MPDTYVVNWIIGACGAIVIIGNLGAIIAKWLKPAFNLSKRVALIETTEQSDNQDLSQIKETNQLLCKGMLVLLDHELTGNSVDKIRKMKEEMQQYLIAK